MRIVVLILLIIVLILLFYLSHDQSKKEGFYTTTSSTDAVSQLATLLHQISGNINSLTSNDSDMTPEQKTMNEDLISQLNNLNASLQVLIGQNRLNTPLDPVSTEELNVDVLNDAKIQQMKQSDSISELKRRLANLQTIYNSYLQKQSEASINYDKIPVYSSCIVSEADGRYTYPTNAP
jgi:hypothetical protein